MRHLTGLDVLPIRRVPLQNGFLRFASILTPLSLRSMAEPLLGTEKPGFSISARYWT